MSNFTTWRSLVDGVEIGAIPDSEDLHARYDAREIDAGDGASISSWSDLTDNGHDLTTLDADPTFRESGIESNPSVDFDNANFDVSFPSISQPFSVFFVIEQHTTTSDDTDLFTDRSNDDIFLHTEDDDDYALGSPNRDVTGGNPDTNPHILSGIFNSPNSILRLDGNQLDSGDSGNEVLAKIEINLRRNTAFDMLELLVYEGDKNDEAESIEEYLDRDTSILS